MLAKASIQNGNNNHLPRDFWTLAFARVTVLLGQVDAFVSGLAFSGEVCRGATLPLTPITLYGGGLR